MNKPNKKEGIDLIGVWLVSLVALFYLVVWSPFIIAGVLFTAILFMKIGWLLVTGLGAAALWWFFDDKEWAWAAIVVWVLYRLLS